MISRRIIRAALVALLVLAHGGMSIPVSRWAVCLQCERGDECARCHAQVRGHGHDHGGGVDRITAGEHCERRPKKPAGPLWESASCGGGLELVWAGVGRAPLPAPMVVSRPLSVSVRSPLPSISLRSWGSAPDDPPPRSA